MAFADPFVVDGAGTLDNDALVSYRARSHMGGPLAPIARCLTVGLPARSS